LLVEINCITQKKYKKLNSLTSKVNYLSGLFIIFIREKRYVSVERLLCIAVEINLETERVATTVFFYQIAFYVSDRAKKYNQSLQCTVIHKLLYSLVIMIYRIDL